MQEISFFLKKYEGVTREYTSSAKALINIIKEETGITVDKNTLDFKGESVYIQTNPSIHSEIFLHKDNIQRRLNKYLV